MKAAMRRQFPSERASVKPSRAFMVASISGQKVKLKIKHITKCHEEGEEAVARSCVCQQDVRPADFAFCTKIR